MTTGTAVATGRRAQASHGVCSLTLSINGVAYRVRKGRVDGVEGWTLRKADGEAYRVELDEDGVLACSCPDTVLGGRPAGCCKHCRSLMAVGLIGPGF